VSDIRGVLERRLLTTRPIADPIQRGLINLQVACAHFEEDFDQMVRREGLSNASFNALRILRGSPDGLPRGEVAQRLIYRKADVTRLLDGLVRRGLVERVRSKSDRRLSLARITPKGQKVLGRIDPLVIELRDRYEVKLSKRDWAELSRLLEALYASHVD
jgi:DNA-binding MarR family transcriptional regulator